MDEMKKILTSLIGKRYVAVVLSPKEAEPVHLMLRKVDHDGLVHASTSFRAKYGGSPGKEPNLWFYANQVKVVHRGRWL